MPTKISTKEKTKKITNVDNLKKKSTKTYKNIKIVGYHQLMLNTYIYDKVEKPTAVVIVIHGMQEHCMRYKNFCEYLNKNNFIAIASDLRGHGLTAHNKSEFGFGENDIFSETVQDQLNIINYAKEKYNLPVYIFGHSYGSMITQKLLQCNDSIEKALICSTIDGDWLLVKIANFLAKIVAPFKKKNAPGGIVEKLIIKAYGRKFERGNWFTKDEHIYNEYLNDELCGVSFPFSFYLSLASNMKQMNKGLRAAENKKVFFICGSKDPLSFGGKYVKPLYKNYIKNNIDAKIKIYENDRHELLNETNRKEVFEDVVKFFKK